MGTINFKTSNYITLSIKPYEIDDFINDTYFMKEMEEETKEYGGTLDDNIYSYIANCYECDKANVETILNKYNFYYYHIAIEYGYYESFSLSIENNYGIVYDDYTDKQAAQKEITQIKQCLKELAGIGMVATFPGWCTSYFNYNETIEAIGVAIQEMREEVENTPTWKQYERG